MLIVDVWQPGLTRRDIQDLTKEEPELWKRYSKGVSGVQRVSSSLEGGSGASHGSQGSSGSQVVLSKKKDKQSSSRGESPKVKTGGTEALIQELQRYYRNAGLTEDQVRKRIAQALKV